MGGDSGDRAEGGHQPPPPPCYHCPQTPPVLPAAPAGGWSLQRTDTLSPAHNHTHLGDGVCWEKAPPPPPGHPQTGAFPGFPVKAGAVHHHQCHFGAFPLPSGPPPPCWRCSGGSGFGPFLSLWCGDSPVTAGIRGSWLHPEAPGTTQDGSWVPASASVPITSSQVPILGSNLGTLLPHIPVSVIWGVLLSLPPSYPETGNEGRSQLTAGRWIYCNDAKISL